MKVVVEPSVTTWLVGAIVPPMPEVVLTVQVVGDGVSPLPPLHPPRVNNAKNNIA
ncbi:MAG: hypothetical protein GWO08_03405 [Gammaproteobacteria bacterium]|nr:hypothetical protein [Gammaproteobacteria bacterium]NIS45917.1 hypothetical protein [candidate division Zixibacteria bacterium]NIV06085.1 hypothetical protein [candidate division Zixibacteria bacterium]